MALKIQRRNLLSEKFEEEATQRSKATKEPGTIFTFLLCSDIFFTNTTWIQYSNEEKRRYSISYAILFK